MEYREKKYLKLKPNNQKVTDLKAVITSADFEKGHIIVKKGKKVFLKITLA